MKAAYLTLGCKVNQYDTEAMEQLLQAAGYQSVPFEAQADLYLVNTCTVTAVADKKSRQMIRRAREAHPGALVCVCGCLAQRQAQAVLAMPEVDAVVGTKNRARIVEIAERLRRGERKIDAVEEIRAERAFEPLRITHSGEHTRANIKICEGCDNYCSYCIIPYARGPVRSRPIADIVQEARDLAAGGVLEVVLTGIHIGSYGKDIGGVGLIDVIEAVGGVQGLARIRLGSLEPRILTEGFCARAAQVAALCPHFHISLQSGSAGVLQRMNRRYTPQEYAQVVANVRAAFRYPAITTDIIAGFAGETLTEHEETLAFIRKIGFARVHVFPYSEREGTAALRLAGPVPKAERRRRAAEIAALAQEQAQAYAAGFVGGVEQALAEEIGEDGLAVGHNERYLPIRFAGGVPGRLHAVRITGRQGASLLGELAE